VTALAAADAELTGSPASDSAGPRAPRAPRAEPGAPAPSQPPGRAGREQHGWRLPGLGGRRSRD
jgi:hypothetical protein